MPVTLDCKNPSLVIVGHWNAAILNEPGWIARHILGVPEGQQVNIQALVVGNQIAPGQVAPERQIWLFDEFGFCCSGQRLEFFTRNIENPTPLFDAASKILELLPHTPIKAVGINFNLHVGEDVETITPLFETQETFDSLGSITSQERVDSIEIATKDLLKIEGAPTPAVTLNINRKTDFKTAEISFNYHVPQTDSSSIIKILKLNPIAYWQNHMSNVAKDCYLIDKIETTYF